MNIQEVVDYVMESPNNTNPIILKQKINEYAKEEILDTNGKLLNSVLPEGYPCETSGIVEILPETNMTLHGGAGHVNCSKLLFEKGKTYIVVIDGVEYVCTGWLPEGAPEDMVTLGNGEIDSVPGGDDVPFLIFTQYSQTYEPYTQGQLHLIYPNYSTVTSTCTITIRTNMATVKPIATKYIPKAAAVANATTDTMVAQFNALLTSLREAGYLAI